MGGVGFEEMGSYFLKRQDTVVQYIAARTILDLCEKTLQRPGYWIARIWWDQEGLDLSGAREMVAAATDREEGREGEEE